MNSESASVAHWQPEDGDCGPGKRSTTDESAARGPAFNELSHAVSNELNERFRRNLATGRWGLRPGKRSLAAGRWGLRPGKRSLAAGRWGLRPGKRSVPLESPVDSDFYLLVPTPYEQ
ncbi:hypothetical protein M3Y99_00315100 [Aphelenchoides fujianensis]|nr:hypothetical protein M3Y99_00315100 [Aphelenchoides fujianensis]